MKLKSMVVFIMIFTVLISVNAKTDNKLNSKEEKSQQSKEDINSLNVKNNIFDNQFVYLKLGGGANYPYGTVTGTGDQMRKLYYMYHASFSYEYPISKYFSLELETGYYEKSFRVSKAYNGKQLEYTVKNRALGLAPLASFNYNYFYLGLGYFLNVNIADTHSEKYESSFDMAYDIDTFENGLVVATGVRYPINKNMVFKTGIKYSIAFNKAYSNHLQDKLGNNSLEIEFALGYIFNFL